MNAKEQLIELMLTLQDLIPPGGEISRAEILAMIEDRIHFPRTKEKPE